MLNMIPTFFCRSEEVKTLTNSVPINHCVKVNDKFCDSSSHIDYDRVSQTYNHLEKLSTF